MIKSSSGLSDEEIGKMVSDAEEHADEDREARELVDARNQGEAMIHGARKSIEDLGDKLDGDDKRKLEEAIGELEEALKGDDKASITAKTETLTQASHKLAEQIYSQAQAEAQAQSQGEQGPPGGAADSNSTKADSKDDVVDAEFEEVGDKDGKGKES